MADWYEAVSGPALAQGDVLLRCPVPSMGTVELPVPDHVDVVVDTLDLVVLTQSCDLEQGKVREVLLAAVRDYQQLAADHGDANPSIKGKDFRKAAVMGNLPSMSLLPPSPDSAMNWSLVDFHQLFSLPVDFVRAVAEDAGDRWRLVPPYREHLAQAFARYFMRVGLPTTLHDFEKFRV
jgi:hypothetical protein